MTCSFIPPYLLSRLVESNGGVPSSSGQHTLVLDGQLRTSRAARTTPLHPVGHPAGVTRVVHDARHTEKLPGDVVRTISDPPTGDVATDEAFDSSGLVWDLFATEFHRESVDGLGTVLLVTVHYGQDYDNAFWDGTQLVFGDGDGVVFERFTRPMDVMAHEFTHGVTQFTTGLAYSGQPGALNESVSDVFAAMTKQRSLGQTSDQADWLIGDQIFRPDIHAKALRSMTEPGTAYDDPRLGKDPQVGSMADYVETDEDSGGVHLNSGIPSRGFAVAALRIGGRSWERVGRVWYDALTSGEVGVQTDFAAFARATVNSAGRLFPDDARVVEGVRAGWSEVGVALGAASPSSARAGPERDARSVTVRRSGGVGGMTRSGELDLDADPGGPEVRDLLTSVDLEALAGRSGGPDRFLYTVQYGEHRVTVPEEDLTPELQRVVQLVLGQPRALGPS